MTTKKSFDEVWNNIIKKAKDSDELTILEKKGEDVEILYTADYKIKAISCPASFFQEWKKRFKSC